MYITVWDEDINDITTFVNYDQVDEFNIDLLQAPDSGVQTISHPGLRQTDPTQ